MMKRSRTEIEVLEASSIDLAKCLVLLSRGTTGTNCDFSLHGGEDQFECKTCSRRFSSFQALGGHRASHKKPRLAEDSDSNKPLALSLAVKHKMHECSICRLEFSTGQALGGHMRRHRVETMKQTSVRDSFLPTLPVLKRSNSSKRIVCMDLNLTPLENDLKLLFEKMAPKVDQFL